MYLVLLLFQLQLADNKITGKLDLLTIYENLIRLDICNNPIESINELKPLVESICKQQAGLKNLTELSVIGCNFAKGNYRDKIFQLLPNLKLVDNYDVNGEFIAEEDEEDEEDEKEYEERGGKHSKQQESEEEDDYESEEEEEEEGNY